MSTSSLSFPHLARRVDPAAREQELIARVPRAGSELTSGLIGHLNNPANNPDELASGIARCATRYIRATEQMGYQDIRRLLGLLTSARHGELPLDEGIERLAADSYTSQHLRGALSNLQTIRQLRIKQEPPNQIIRVPRAGEVDGFQETFLQTAILLTRIAAPLGINIVNPAWSQDGMPTGLPAQKTYLLWHVSSKGVIDDRDAIAIKPTVRGDAVRVKLIERGESWESTTAEATLSSEQSILIGRRLLLSTKPAMERGSLFGLNIPDLAVEPQLDPSRSFRNTENSVHFSRAAIQLVLVDGLVYVLDRGCYHGITCPLENGACMTYRPHTAVDGKHTVLGETEISNVPRPRR